MWPWSCRCLVDSLNRHGLVKAEHVTGTANVDAKESENVSGLAIGDDYFAALLKPLLTAEQTSLI
jgi:hypothetical protein